MSWGLGVDRIQGLLPIVWFGRAVCDRSRALCLSRVSQALLQNKRFPVPESEGADRGLREGRAALAHWFRNHLHQPANGVGVQVRSQNNWETEGAG